MRGKLHFQISRWNPTYADLLLEIHENTHELKRKDNSEGVSFTELTGKTGPFKTSSFSDALCRFFV